MSSPRITIAGSLLAALLAGSVTLAQDTQNLATLGEVVQADPGLAQVLDPAAKIQVVAAGFDWAEGPVWVPEASGPGYLLFSDIPKNSIMKVVPNVGVSLHMKPSGYTGIVDYGREPGTNGLVLDAQGRLTACEHGDRRISVLTVGGGKLTLADRFDGKRFNSPNDLVFAKNGDLYFTDPPYGLPQQANDPMREMDYCGVYRLSKEGKLTLLNKEMTRPNGIGLSPDEKTLYVANSDPQKAQWMAFPINTDGSLGTGKVFADVTEAVRQRLPGLPDGLEVDAQGNLFASGPGGIYIYQPDGKLLGRISTGERTANCTFGGPDKSILYMTADMYICRIQTKTKGLWMVNGK